MKKSEMKNVIEGLKKVKLPKLEDKNLSTALFKVFMKLCGEQRKFEQEVKDVQDAFLSVHKDEQDVVFGLQQQYTTEVDRVKQMEIAKEINSHAEYHNAVRACNEKIDAIGEEEVELAVEPIDAEKFQEQYQKQDYELSVIEQIFPLFK